ncbi:hypothetical protein [Saccharothrix hoggarensis]|uniref:Uncharacterized protein n=1 Tax=Saccharothrix hoggarensis TaxID=913853 RepID=A0ABW3QP10_9PSEU
MSGGSTQATAMPGGRSYPPQVIVISEDKDTATYLPPLASGIAMEGSGRGGTTAAAFTWITDAPYTSLGYDDAYRRGGPRRPQLGCVHVPVERSFSCGFLPLGGRPRTCRANDGRSIMADFVGGQSPCRGGVGDSSDAV